MHREEDCTIFNNGLTNLTNIPTDPYTVTSTDRKTNMCHIHTSIISRHLTTRGNNKIMCTLHCTLAALKRYSPASLVAPLPNSEQTNLPSSNHTYTKLTPNHIHHNYALSATHTPSLELHPHMHHTVPLDLWTDPDGADGRRS